MRVSKWLTCRGCKHTYTHTLLCKCPHTHTRARMHSHTQTHSSQTNCCSRENCWQLSLSWITRDADPDFLFLTYFNVNSCWSHRAHTVHCRATWLHLLYALIHTAAASLPLSLPRVPFSVNLLLPLLLSSPLAVCPYQPAVFKHPSCLPSFLQHPHLPCLPPLTLLPSPFPHRFSPLPHSASSSASFSHTVTHLSHLHCYHLPSSLHI